MRQVIRTEGVSRDFYVGREPIHALKNISVGFEEGTLTILKGRSGSGKTTLLNLLGLIDKPTEGSITLLDREISSMSETEKNSIRQKEFGFVFQSGALIPNMTVYENVELVLRLAKLPEKERKNRVLQCIEAVGLSKKTNHYPEELSGGEMQRAGIARAIAHRPKIMLVDEPTSSLDYNTGLLVVKLFKELIAREGTTIIMTTHDPKLIPIADYMYSLKDGEIINE
ncbi:ABC transporter ATP-binding protein [Clostridium swellfunianum]|uniref:ABC transporter ATP-binding protein n=1 Tax=Clostridium swellfunianum TaxID=1367462 RepID=UPI0020308FA1|nr:ABC transporter ATP-binding protein [Clostridium swellfunianum]